MKRATPRIARRAGGRTAVLLLAAALFAFASDAFAAAWWRLPVWGAEVRAFALDPFEPGTVYCGTSRGNFYRSTDGGESWEPLRQTPAFPDHYVTVLQADRAVRGRLWAALVGDLSGSVLARSDDGGQTWTPLLASTKTVLSRAFAIAPGPPGRLAVGGDEGVRVSSDGGRTWARTGEGVPGLQQVESLAYDPADARTLYAGTWRQAFRTRDGGASWARIAEGMVLDATVYSWDFDGADTRDVWVSTCGWVYRSHDGGDRWTRFTSGFTNRRSHAVRRDPARPNVVYAATVAGLHRSDDGGATWARVSRESLVVTALEVDRRSGRLFVGTEGEGVFYSDDGGRTLQSGSRGLTESRVSEIVTDPSDPRRVFFFRSFAGDESGVWEASGRDVRKVSREAMPASASLAALRAPDGRTALIVSSSAGLRVSRDGGARWSAPEEPPPGAPIAMYPTAFGEPVVVTTAGVFRTSDASRFAAVPGGARPASAAELLADGAGRPLIELRSGDAVAYWDGEAWSGKKKSQLGGGIFMPKSPTKAAGTWTTLQDVDGTLFWQEGPSLRAFTSPRPDLTLAAAASAGGGRVYVGTMGDGIFLFEP
ncbi:MAG TPA: hypothetical protein VH854_06795 [Thermoanaerobaculia bacterium]|nr:hypothetical protein [Thermoanaerobaculia bacterium]